MGCTLRSPGQGGDAIGHDEARFPGVANVVVLGRADFKPRDLRSDRGYRWRLGVWRLAAFGMAWIENRKEWTSTTFFDLADMGRSGAAPVHKHAVVVGSRLLGGDVDRGFSVFPRHAQGAAGRGVVEGDGEVFHRRRELGDFHVDAGEVVARAGIGGAPFAGFLADDELPFVGVGHGEDRVAAGWDGGAADVEIGVGDERGRFICAGAPDLAVGNEITENFAALHAWAGVRDLYGF